MVFIDPRLGHPRSDSKRKPRDFCVIAAPETDSTPPLKCDRLEEHGVLHWDLDNNVWWIYLLKPIIVRDDILPVDAIQR